jgi:hypothetical protein
MSQTDLQVSPGEVETLLQASESDLFAALVPEAEKQELHSFDGVVARGRIIFRGAFLDVQDTVCGFRAGQGDTMNTQIDLVAMVATAIVGKVSLAGIPAVPMAALIVKIGLGKLCASWSPGDG